MRVAAVQHAPVYLDREATVDKVVALIAEAAAAGAELIAFPETFVAGYPSWADFTNASAFNNPVQKQAFAKYLDSAVDVSAGHLDPIVAASAEHGMFVYVGIAERSMSGGSIYATLAAIHPVDGLVGTHRKLKPTYGERLMWADGDGAGLRAYDFAGTRVSGLNCWENWMPPPVQRCMPRALRCTSPRGRARPRSVSTSAGSLQWKAVYLSSVVVECFETSTFPTTCRSRLTCSTFITGSLAVAR